MSDYRNTKYCPELKEILQKKEKLVLKIKEEHPRAKNMYNYIHSNDGSYKKEFLDIYNYKCAYCGVSISIIPKSKFEIDHFVYEKSFASKTEAGQIDNLILSCSDCNHNKSAFVFPEEDKPYLYPDDYKLGNTFVRDEKYYICIAKPFKDNKTVNDFYYKLRLDKELHRIDYLLMNMIGLRDNLQKTSKIRNIMNDAITFLYSKRNIMG